MWFAPSTVGAAAPLVLGAKHVSNPAASVKKFPPMTKVKPMSFLIVYLSGVSAAGAQVCQTSQRCERATPRLLLVGSVRAALAPASSSTALLVSIGWARRRGYTRARAHHTPQTDSAREARWVLVHVCMCVSRSTVSVYSRCRCHSVCARGGTQGHGADAVGAHHPTHARTNTRLVARDQVGGVYFNLATGGYAGGWGGVGGMCKRRGAFLVEGGSLVSKPGDKYSKGAAFTNQVRRSAQPQAPGTRTAHTFLIPPFFGRGALVIRGERSDYCGGKQGWGWGWGRGLGLNPFLLCH